MNAQEAKQWLAGYGSDINDPESKEMFAQALSTLATELEVAEAFHRVAVAERNAAWHERDEAKRWSQFHDAQAQRLMRERDELRRLVVQK